jgi:hypothetical protein
MVFVSVWLSAALIAQAATPLQRFNRSPGDDHYAKMRIISETVLGKTPASPAQVEELLAAAMKDPDPAVRRQAVGSMSSIIMINSMPSVPPGQEWAAVLQPIVEPLRGYVEQAAKDSDAQVRIDALRGIMASAISAQPGTPLPLDIVKRLVFVFDSDPDATVRSFAVTGLHKAYSSTDPVIRALTKPVMLRALQDPDPYVVQYAGWAAFEARDPEAVPLLIRQLKNPSPVARMGVAAGLQAYSAEALRYLPQLEDALAREPEGPTRKTLEAAIEKIKARRSPD